MNPSNFFCHFKLVNWVSKEDRIVSLYETLPWCKQHLQYTSKETAEQYLIHKTFFNLNWMDEQVKSALNYGYKKALKGAHWGAGKLKNLASKAMTKIKTALKESTEKLISKNKGKW